MGWCPQAYSGLCNSDDFWSRIVSQEECLAELEVPLIGSFFMECASLEDDVLFCLLVLYQMCSRCVPVHPDVPVLCQRCYM